MNKHFFFFLILSVVFNSVRAQYTNLKFETYSTLEGLSSSTCLEVFQDSEGFLWIGTIDGLNRYDGYTFEVFRPIPSDTTSISNNRVYSIVEDKFGNLWIGTLNGLNVFERKRGIFHRINLFRNDTDIKRTTGEINDLVYDLNTNVIWVASKNGLSKANIDNTVKGDFSGLNFSHYLNDTDSLNGSEVTSMVLVNDGKLWVMTDGNYLNHYDPQADNFRSHPIDLSFTQGLDHLPKVLLEDSSGKIWFGNDLSKLAFIDEHGVVNKLNVVSDNTPIYDLYQSNTGEIWVATGYGGIYIFSESGQFIQRIVRDPGDPFSLPINQTSKILQDKDGIFWIATYNEGIAKLDLTKSLFGHYYYQPGGQSGLSSKIAQFVMEDSKMRIWVGTDGGGLNLFDEKRNTFKSYRYDENDSFSLSSDKLLYMEESHDGSIWVCTFDRGLNKFNPSTGKADRYIHSASDPYSISQNSVWCAVEDKNERLWLGTQSTGLNLYDPETGHFFSYMNEAENSASLTSDFVFSLFIDSNDRLFVGTSLGLCMLDLNTLKERIPEKIAFKRIDEKNILGIRVNYITEDHAGNIWLGTDLGLHKLSKSLKLIDSYSTQDGLPNNLVVGVKEDNNNELWITTKSGISLFSPESENFKNFNVNDGLQGVEYQSKSIDKTLEGRIIAGGINGFNIFNPDDIIQDSLTLLPKITVLKVLNKAIRSGDELNGRVLFEEPLSETKEIVLTHNEGYITLDFVALHFKNPERVKYAYKMHGADQGFLYPGSNRVANYSGLPPGTYTFEVRASLDGQWSESEKAELQIRVMVPPWKTWWAFGIYVILVMLISWLVIRYYTKIIGEVREHELDQMKLRFFMNVSHEFRTPLTLILNPVDKLISSYDNPEIVKSSAIIIQRSAKNLLNLVNQLLDFRKMDLGKAPLDPIKADIVNFIKDLFHLFGDLANGKSIDFSFNSPSSAIFIWFDPDKLEKIVSNLLSNAIKFTPANGKIEIVVGKSSKRVQRKSVFGKTENVDFVEIKVKDSGIGLKKDQQNQVFDRFFHLDDNTKTGTGIGLNFTRSLVEQHDGEIEVESEYGKGSCFTVRLPLDSNNLRNALKSNKEVRRTINEFDMNGMKSLEYQLAISDTDTSDDEGDSIDTLLLTVLVVEDNRELRVHLKNELKSHFKVKEAANGKEGLEKALKFYPDIIISDVMMPEMDGFEMCAKIKTNPEVSHIPIILLTARSMEEDRIEGYNMGADAYLPKPFNINVLKVRINNLLESKKKLREKFMQKANILPSSEITTNTLDEQFLDIATNLILENISDSEFGLDQLLSGMAVSRSQFYRKIQSLTGQNPSNFIRSVRLKYAAELLKQQNFSIKEISYKSGFNSSAYFSKTFRELFSLSPNEFVKDYLENKK